MVAKTVMLKNPLYVEGCCDRHTEFSGKDMKSGKVLEVVSKSRYGYHVQDRDCFFHVEATEVVE